ncbi:hypothetical protein ACFYOC_22695 [Nocardiopsis alba]|uniref:hypothetical protein n=1 Tax=Nocardiopsis alba TaxID=53437 RepID=UPI00368BE8C7
MRNLITHLRTRGPTAVRAEGASCARLPFTPPPPAPPVDPLARLVRPYVLESGQRRRVRRIDRSRLGLELLLEISRLEVAA